MHATRGQHPHGQEPGPTHPPLPKAQAHRAFTHIGVLAEQQTG